MSTDDQTLTMPDLQSYEVLPIKDAPAPDTIPPKGHIFYLNKILFEITFVDYKRGEFRCRRVEHYKILEGGMIARMKNGKVVMKHAN